MYHFASNFAQTLNLYRNNELPVIRYLFPAHWVIPQTLILFTETRASKYTIWSESRETKSYTPYCKINMPTVKYVVQGY